MGKLAINEELKKLIGEETLKALEEALKDQEDLVLEPKSNFIPKFRFDEVSTQLKDAKVQNTKLSTDLETATKNAGNIEEFKSQVTKLQEENRLATEKYESEIASRERSYRLDNALREVGVKNSKAVMALLNQDAIKIDGDKLLGFDDQIEALKKSDAYLFQEVQSQGPKVDRFGNPIQTNGGEKTVPEEAAAIAEKYGFFEKQK